MWRFVVEEAGRSKLQALPRWISAILALAFTTAKFYRISALQIVFSEPQF